MVNYANFVAQNVDNGFRFRLKEAQLCRMHIIINIIIIAVVLAIAQRR